MLGLGANAGPGAAQLCLALTAIFVSWRGPAAPVPAPVAPASTDPDTAHAVPLCLAMAGEALARIEGPGAPAFAPPAPALEPAIPTCPALSDNEDPGNALGTSAPAALDMFGSALISPSAPRPTLPPVFATCPLPLVPLIPAPAPAPPLAPAPAPALATPSAPTPAAPSVPTPAAPSAPAPEAALVPVPAAALAPASAAAVVPTPDAAPSLAGVTAVVSQGRAVADLGSLSVVAGSPPFPLPLAWRQLPVGKGSLQVIQ